MLYQIQGEIEIASAVSCNEEIKKSSEKGRENERAVGKHF